MTKTNSILGPDPIKATDQVSSLRAELQKVIHDDSRGRFEKFQEAVALKRKLTYLTIIRPSRIRHREIFDEIAGITITVRTNGEWKG